MNPYHFFINYIFLHKSFSLFGVETAYVITASLVLAAVTYIIMNSISKNRNLRFTTKNIAYIAMLSTISITTTIVVAMSMPLAVLPPIRIAVEGLMVKITGYIFGPVIGILSAIITDILIMLFVPSFIHPAYMITIVGFGFIAGIAGELKRVFVHKTWVLIIISHIFIIGFATATLILTYFAPQFCQKDPNGVITVCFKPDQVPFTKTMPIKKWVMMLIISIGTTLILVLFWIIWIYYILVKKDYETFNGIIPVIILSVVTEYLITVLIASWGDSYLLSKGNDNYGLAMVSRLSIAPLKILINTTIIYITWRTVHRLISVDR